MNIVWLLIPSLNSYYLALTLVKLICTVGTIQHNPHYISKNFSNASFLFFLWWGMKSWRTCSLFLYTCSASEDTSTASLSVNPASWTRCSAACAHGAALLTCCAGTACRQKNQEWKKGQESDILINILKVYWYKQKSANGSIHTHKRFLLDEVCPSSVKFTKLVCKSGAGGAVRHLNQKVSRFIQQGLERAPFWQSIRDLCTTHKQNRFVFF